MDSINQVAQPKPLNSKQRYLMKRGRSLESVTRTREAKQPDIFKQVLQYDGFMKAVRENYINSSEAYRSVYKGLIRSFILRGKTKDFYTTYEIGLWEALSERMVIKILEDMYYDGFFNDFVIYDDRIYISLRLLY